MKWVLIMVAQISPMFNGGAPTKPIIIKVGQFAQPEPCVESRNRMRMLDELNMTGELAMMGNKVYLCKLANEDGSIVHKTFEDDTDNLNESDPYEE